MRITRMLTAACAAALALALSLGAGAPAGAEPEAAAKLIANASVKEMRLDAEAVQRIFLGKKKTWEGGGLVVLAILQEGPTHEAFLSAYVGKTPSQFTSHWRKLVFTGKDGEPRSFATEEELARFVAATPGAVGYVAPGTAAPGAVELAVAAK